MRNFSIIIVLLACFSSAYGQTIRGTVYDRATDSPLSLAVIYISGTSVGTYSDSNGNFELDISKYSSEPITISLIGYSSFTLTEHSTGKSLKIYLSTKINELNEVLIKGKKGKWETYLYIFKKEFLGSSKNASQCDILNERDLRFFNITDSTLSAYSSNPLIIVNKALGYTITYFLDKFIYKYHKDGAHIFNETCFILGSYMFKDDFLTLSEREKQSVEERREKAYLGSRMHFFRMLYSGSIHHRGRYVISLTEETNTFPVFVIKTDMNSKSFGIKKDSVSGYLKFEREFTVSYKGNSSKIYIKRDSVYFEKYGFYDPFGVDFSGDMSNRRMGDLLPYEYSIK